MTSRQAAIYGVSGPELSSDEIDFISEVKPLGFIIFSRNIRSLEQVSNLVSHLKSFVKDDETLVLIDQEGGRVARLRPPLIRGYPKAEIYGKIFELNPVNGMRAAYLGAVLMAKDLLSLGINVDCTPCLDLSLPQTSDVIGDRSFSKHPEVVGALGQSVAQGFLDEGALPVIKHIPGHGRSAVDSHKDLPRVAASDAELASDLLPFHALSGALMAMTAHVIFDAWDVDQCATLSPFVINEVIRKKIGFDGLLMSDDLDMKALSGEIGKLALTSQRAGCDVVLNCWAKMTDMVSIAEKLSAPSLQAQDRMSCVCAALASATGSATIRERQAALIERRDQLRSL